MKEPDFVLDKTFCEYLKQFVKSAFPEIFSHQQRMHSSCFLVDYMGNEVPVKVHMEAYNPKIPLSSMDSGIPVVVFNFTVTNSTSQAVKVSKMFYIVLYVLSILLIVMAS